MPKIRGDTTHVHPIPILLAGILAGILGGIVSARAAPEILSDFFRVRLETDV